MKRERENLMATLGALRTDTGKAGGELQQDDIAHLRRDAELKLKKLNELRQAGCAIMAHALIRAAVAVQHAVASANLTSLLRSLL